MASSASRATRRSFERSARRIRVYRTLLEKETGKTNREIGEEIMTDVKASRPGKGVPRDLGTLASTGEVTGPNRKDEVRLAFGGPAAPYAVVQHERLDFAHDLGEARYLVRGLERWEPDGSAAIRALRENNEHAIQIARRAA